MQTARNFGTLSAKNTSFCFSFLFKVGKINNVRGHYILS